MKTIIATHIFVWDGQQWPDRIRRCAECPYPEQNRHHDVPDRSTEQDEHRRRVGEERE